MLESVAPTLEKEDGRALAAEGGNAWLLGTVRTLYEIPTVSSRFDCAAESVPRFTRWRWHGYVNLAAVPFNAEEDVETAFLQCLEAGALPNFRITAKDNTVLKDTGYAFLYNTGYAGVGERLGEMLKASAALYDGLFDQPITRPCPPRRCRRHHLRERRAHRRELRGGTGGCGRRDRTRPAGSSG